MIRKIIAFVLFLTIASTFSIAQTTTAMKLTDEQVLELAKEASKNGDSEQQIAIQLRSKGVGRKQMERVKKLYQEEKNAEKSGNIKNKPEKRRSLQEEETTVDELNAISNKIDNEVKLENNVFGRNIFNNANLSFEPNSNMATPVNYRLGPGDEVIIDVFGANQTTIRNTISPDGSINVDVLGPVYLNGMTISEANTYLKKRLAKIYAGIRRGGSTRSDIRLTLGQIRTIQVNIMGEVKVPGTYRLSSFSGIFHALYKAGGISELGSLRNIKLVRSGKTIHQIDIYDFLMKGSMNDDTRLEEGDVILVPTYDALVNITGKVKRPMFYEMKKNESIKTLLEYAGGFSNQAYRSSLNVIRENGKEYQIYTVDNIDFSSFQLEDGDAVNVGTMLDRFENKVEIKGAVYREGQYQLSPKLNSVRDLVNKADGLMEDAFTNRAVLHRTRPDRTLEIMALDIKGIMDGSTPDVPLQKNDIIYIPSIHDLKDMGTLTINGEVAAPGTFPYADNTTLEDLIIQAGGLLESASTVRVDVTRRVKDSKSITVGDSIATMFTFAIKDNFVVDGKPGFVLEPYDQVFVRKSPGYVSQVNVTTEGEVVFPGTYTMTTKTERISELIKKSGGFTKFAYVKGAKLIRTMNDEEKEKLAAALKLAQNSSDSIAQIEISNTYYIGIDLEKAMKNPGSNYDVVLREGDVLEVPQYNNTVKINGAVMYPNTVTYDEKMTVRDLIHEAGGFSDKAKKRKVYIIYMNGHVKVARLGSSKYVEPGCEIIVPTKSENKNKNVLASVLSAVQGFSSLATMVATLIYVLKK
ncbi:MAG: SLBB domain-containing protein [Bacteroidaceae bacterium]|nr:SLBB domain-containing protein [Bacteroidaceae bacterium]